LPRIPRLVGGLGRILLIIAILGVSGIAQRPETVSAADVGLPYFGVYLNGHDVASTQRAKDVGAGAVTIQVSWTVFEPAQAGTLSAAGTAVVDPMVAAAVAKGLTPIFVVGDAPTWAAVSAHGALLPGRDTAFATFVRELAKRYAPLGVHHWMLWPEPDAIQYPTGELTRGAWGDQPEYYASVMKQASQAIKGQDSSAKLILGPLAHDRFYPAKSAAWCPVPYPDGHYNCGGIFSYEFLEKIFNGTGLASYVDAVAINSYAYYGAAWETDQPGYDAGAKLRHVRNRLNQLGVSLPLVVGESGVWSTATPTRPYRVNNALAPDELESSPARQAEYVGQMYARAREAGAVSVIWFTLDEVDPTVKYGLFDDSMNPKPSFTAYRQAATALGSMSRSFAVGSLVTVVSGNAERYGFADANNNATLVVWAINGTNASNPSAQIAVRGAFTAYNQNGDVVQASGSSSAGSLYTVSGGPLYLRGPAYRTMVPVSLRRG
jgi:hypothetical protein